MVKKGNAPVPQAHFRKHWCPSAAHKGYIKNHFNQAVRAKKRRYSRMVKAMKMFPRPVRWLRPIVHCPTQRYNMKTRAGRGFSFRELSEAKVNRRFARTIGIAVDRRRINYSQESLDTNVKRLKEYMSRLILFPLSRLKRRQTRKERSKRERRLRENIKPKQQSLSPLGPLKDPRKTQSLKSKRFEKPRKLTEQEKHRHIFYFLRKVQRDKKLIGVRVKRQKKREEKAKEAKDK